MIKYFCDKCGKKMDSTNINIEYEDTVGFDVDLTLNLYGDACDEDGNDEVQYICTKCLYEHLKKEFECDSTSNIN